MPPSRFGIAWGWEAKEDGGVFLFGPIPVFPPRIGASGHFFRHNPLLKGPASAPLAHRCAVDEELITACRFDAMKHDRRDSAAGRKGWRIYVDSAVADRAFGD